MSKETIKAITGDGSKDGSFQEVAKAAGKPKKAGSDRRDPTISEEAAVKQFENQSGYSDSMKGREGY